ncbi:MAG TPA: GAF domain-containing protein, partial [Gemmatimonadaceae bacterium]|nr:GAF domain-containing protein [Gemmatimonadaceae bacterium]
MSKDQILGDPARLAALHKTALLETPAEDCFDRFTRLAGQILGVPTVVLSLVDSRRQFFKSVVGKPAGLCLGWNPLDATFCEDVVTTGDAFIVPDIATDRTVAGRPVRAAAYAGVPLTTDEGEIIGALSALDDKPHKWTSREMDVLTALSSAIMSEIQRRVAERAAHDAQLRMVAERTLAHSVQQQMPVGVIVAEVPSGRLVSVNAQMTEIFRMSFTPAADLKAYKYFVGFH